MFSSEERSGLVVTLVGGALLVTALLFGLGFCSTHDAPPSRPPAVAAAPLPLGHVHGKAVDRATGFGLATRAIEITGVEARSDHRIAPPRANAPGEFEVRALPVGRCRVRVTAEGYVAVERDVTVEAGATVELGTVELVALVTLAGRVVDAAGGSVAVRAVTIVVRRDGEEVARARSDDHSSFSFEQLLPARYELDVPASPDHDSLLAPRAVDATGGGAQRGLDLVVVPSFALAGQLVPPVGSEPARALTVDGTAATLRGDGRFELAGRRAGPGTAVVALADGTERRFPFSLPCDPVTWRLDATETEIGAEPESAAPPAAEAASSDGRARLFVRVRTAEGRGVAARLDLVDDASGAPLGVAFTTLAGDALLVALPDRGVRVAARSGGLAGVATAACSEGTPADLEIVVSEPPP